MVIYEGTDPVTESNVAEAQISRNQFVWVPVANVHDMYGTDANGKKWGKLYTFSSDSVTPVNWTEQDGVISITNVKMYREPDVVTTDSSNGVTLTQLELEFNNMIASVTTYGGFYIGRYETGNLSQSEALVVKNNNNINYQTWYTMYTKSKGIAANSNVTTTMIWGCQWDAVMRWMYNSGNEEKKVYTYDGTGKGNFSETQGSTNKAIPTGSNQKYAVNNIYDMAGNVQDWIMEAYNTDKRATRGGHFNANNKSGASYRNYSAPTYKYQFHGSRVALYM